MTKPFSPSELVARVKAHLARYERLIGSNMPQNDIIEIRGIKIDKTARRVWVNGEEKQFTTKEFDLLTFLAENPNHVFTTFSEPFFITSPAPMYPPILQAEMQVETCLVHCKDCKCGQVRSQRQDFACAFAVWMFR